MSSVTFSTTVGGDGSTVTDDDNATTGLGNGGALIRLVPMMQQVVNVASYVVSVGGAASSDAIDASASADAAAASASAAAASYDSFDDRYLGAKSSDPTLDNDGNALLTGAIYWNTASSVMKVWSGSAWVSYNPAISYLPTAGGTMTGAITFASGQTFTGTLPLTGGTMTGNLTLDAYTEKVATLATSGTIALNPSTGTTLSCAAAGTVTFTDSLSSGQSISLLLTNGSTYTINWPTTTWVTADGNTAPTLSASNTLVFWKISSTLYGALVGKSA
jgi:hypothetical protein